MNKAIGIDLGTTYCCVGFYNSIKKNVEIISNEYNEKLIPSFISIINDELIIGSKAKENNTENAIYDIKRLIGRDYSENNYKFLSFNVNNIENKPYINFLNKHMSPEELSSLILIYLKEMAEKYLKYNITDAVITIPAYFTDQQRQATAKAGMLAGLNVLRIINEPTAAAIAYGIDKISDDKRIIIVIDIGGGTTDISLLSLEEGVFEVITTSGNSNLGGIDIDNLLVKYIADKLNIDISNKYLLKDLRIKAEQIKKELSIKKSIKINDIIITQDIFNDLCMDIFSDFLKPIDNIDKNNIDDIILVGGTTRIPKLRELISQYFNNKKLYYDINPDEAIATGAAIQAAILSGVKDIKLDEIILLDIVPLSLGIETTGGIMKIIIPKGTTIPFKKTEIFSTAYDNQTYVKIQIFEGERILTEHNNKLGEFIISDIKPKPKGIPKIEVTYYINNNGILEVSAIENTLGKIEKCIITHDKLTYQNDNITKIISEAEKYKDEDNIYKYQKELKEKLNNLCNTIINNTNKYDTNIILEVNNIINNIDNINDYENKYNNLINLLQNSII